MRTFVPNPSRSASIKEPLSMPKRLVVQAAILTMVATGFFVLLGASASAASPWWQVLSGSRPTNLWEPGDNVQEIVAQKGEFNGIEGAAARIDIGGEDIGCLGTPDFGGELFCNFFYGGYPVVSTAAQLQATLESALGTKVEVTGGPVGGEPFIVTVLDSNIPPITLFQEPQFAEFGHFSTRILSEGGSGRLVLTATNLGNAPVVAADLPVTIEDELPEGVVGTSVEGFAGVKDKFGPVECALDTDVHVTCTFEGTLPSYEAIEVEVHVNLTGQPPAAGNPGKVTVSGGGAPPVELPQPIKISPEPVKFGIEQFSSQTEEEGGEPATQAGGHPFQLVTTVQANSGPPSGAGSENRRVRQPALVRNLRFPLPPGLIGNAAAMPRCSMNDFFAHLELIANQCSSESAVGVVAATVIEPGTFGFMRVALPVFNLPPGPGEPARLGFTVIGNPVVINTQVDTDHGYRIVGSVSNVTQVVDLLSSTLVLWGAPGDPEHDSARGWNCGFHLIEFGTCERSPNLSERAFLRQPVACDGPLVFQSEMEPWNVLTGSVFDTASFSAPGMSGCNRVPFDPRITAVPTSSSSGGSTGLDFRLDMPNAGLLNKDAIAEGQAKTVEVTLPEGVTVNPSQANGLGACAPADYARETFDSPPGQGCPEASKIGRVNISTPLLEEEVHGSVYVATPNGNPFGSLLALYLVAKIPERGILVKQAGMVQLDPDTGQIMTTFDDLPQIPFDTFDLHFFGGDRAPLVMPSTCGNYDITAKFTPWQASDPNNPQPGEIITRTSAFTVDRGPNGGPCPSGTPPFKPGFTAGTINNAAGKYSPLTARLTRQDGEQEFSRFSLKLPKGLIGKLAGVSFCSDAAIAAARARTGPSGAQEELDSSSCPDASQVGRTLVGAGVGPTLTYAPGKVYLAGPYKGKKLSIVAITTAKVGPFDLGNVVIRQGLKIDPNTAEVSTDGASSDPIPHILQGIVVHARDIRIYVDRQDFVLNPTSCERMSAAAAVIGSGLNFGSSADDQSVDVTVPFQAADCASLGFKPKLSLKLRGGTRRGAHPSLRAILTTRKGDANIGAAQVTLPHSEFLEQAHIRTVCTRVQFAAGGGNGSQCPKGSVYGRAKAVSPLLDEPLVGHVYLRSSNHPLPDLVAALHSAKVDINLVGRIDSVRGGIRNTFEAVPDAPVTKFVLEMQGGKKGLLVNSTDICRGKHRAKASFTGQNGKRRGFKPLVKARCGGKHKRRSKH